MDGPESIISSMDLPNGIQKNLENLVRLLKEAASIDGSNLKSLKKDIIEYAKANGIATEKIKSLINSVKKQDDLFSKYRNTMKDLADQTSSSSNEHKRLGKTIENLMIGYKGMSSAIKKSIQEIEKSNSGTKRGNEQLKDQFMALQQSIVETKKKAIEDQKLSLAQKKLAKETQTYSEKLKESNKIIGAIGGSFNSLIASFGAQTIASFGAQTFTIGNAVKSVLDYNQSMYDLKRTYSVLGSSTSDMSDAFDSVAKNTTFSKQQFADFANTIKSSYSGIDPSLTQIANFAEMLQNQFGPNVETAIKVSTELLQTFEKYPPAINAVMKMSTLLKEVQSPGNSGSEKELKTQQAILAVYMEKYGISFEQRKRMLMGLDGAKNKEQELLDTNKEMAKLMQKTSDSVLKMGQSLEPMIKTVTAGMNIFMGMVERLPAIAFLGVGAFQAVGSVLKSEIVGAMDIIPGRIEAWINKIGVFNSKLSETSGKMSEVGSGGSGGRKSQDIGNSNRLMPDQYDTKTGKPIKYNKPNLGKQVSLIGGGDKASEEFSDQIIGSAKKVDKINDIGNKKRESIKDISNKKRAEQTVESGKRLKSDCNEGGKAIKNASKGFNSGLSKQAKIVGSMGILAGVMSAFTEYSSSKAQGFDPGEATKRSATQGISVAAGTVVGATVGSMIPVIGTAVGGMLGGIGGGMIGDMLNKPSSERLKKKQEAEEAAKAAKADKDASGKLDETANVSQVMKLSREWDNIKKIHKENSDALASQRDLLTSQANVLNDMFILTSLGAEKAFGKAFSATARHYQEANDFLEKIGKRQEEMSLLFDIDINKRDLSDVGSLIDEIQRKIDSMSDKHLKITTELKELKQSEASIDSIKSKQEELEKINFKRTGALALQEDLLKAQETAISGIKDISAALNAITFGHLKVQLDMNSAVDSRLSAERDLMEASNFGMGASVKMMQKQVDLSYTNIKMIQKSLSLQDEKISKSLSLEAITGNTDKKENERSKAIIKNAFYLAKQSDSAEERAIIVDKELSKIGDLVKNEKALETVKGGILNEAKAYDEMQAKSLQQQKKIYDMTKNIREGYLDALSEMAIGAGEFEAIIGTQEMGVTQLMDAVKGVTGENRLNTMAVGGITDVTSAAGKARSGQFGSYTTSGVNFGPITGKAQEAMNTDIYGYQNSIDKINKGKGEGATAGFIGSNTEHMNSVRAAQAKDTTVAVENLNKSMSENVREGVSKAIKENNGLMVRGVNVGLGGSVRTAPGQENAPIIGRATAFGASLAKSSTSQTPARTNLYAPSVGAKHGKLPTPPNMKDSSQNLMDSESEKTEIPEEIKEILEIKRKKAILEGKRKKRGIGLEMKHIVQDLIPKGKMEGGQDTKEIINKIVRGGPTRALISKIAGEELTEEFINQLVGGGLIGETINQINPITSLTQGRRKSESNIGSGISGLLQKTGFDISLGYQSTSKNDTIVEENMSKKMKSVLLKDDELKGAMKDDNWKKVKNITETYLSEAFKGKEEADSRYLKTSLGTRIFKDLRGSVKEENSKRREKKREKERAEKRKKIKEMKILRDGIKKEEHWKELGERTNKILFGKETDPSMMSSQEKIAAGIALPEELDDIRSTAITGYGKMKVKGRTGKEINRGINKDLSYSGPSGAMKKVMQLKAKSKDEVKGIKEQKEAKDLETKAFMNSIIGEGIKVRDGETAGDAFSDRAFKIAGTGGNKIWEKSPKEIKEWRENVAKAKKMFLENRKNKSKKGRSNSAIGSGEQMIRQSAEQSKVTNSIVQEEFENNRREQGDISGLGTGTSGGSGGETHVFIHLDEWVKGEIKNNSNLRVTLEQA